MLQHGCVNTAPLEWNNPTIYSVRSRIRHRIFVFASTSHLTLACIENIISYNLVENIQNTCGSDQRPQPFLSLLPPVLSFVGFASVSAVGIASSHQDALLDLDSAVGPLLLLNDEAMCSLGSASTWTLKARVTYIKIFSHGPLPPYISALQSSYTPSRSLRSPGHFLLFFVPQALLFLVNKA